MTEVGQLIADMVRAGVDPELIGRTAEALSHREAVLVPDEAAERRRAKDVERKRLRKSAEVRGTDAPSPDKETSPTPPKEINPNPVPPSPPKGGSSPAAFPAQWNREFEETFWPEYPHRVGKADARGKFAVARRKVPLETIMAAVGRYAAKTDDRPWCNPATWLHQERWTDEAAAPVARAGPVNPMRAVIANLSADMEAANAEPTRQIEGNRPSPLRFSSG